MFCDMGRLLQKRRSVVHIGVGRFFLEALNPLYAKANFDVHGVSFNTHKTPEQIETIKSGYSVSNIPKGRHQQKRLRNIENMISIRNSNQEINADEINNLKILSFLLFSFLSLFFNWVRNFLKFLLFFWIFLLYQSSRSHLSYCYINKRSE